MLHTWLALITFCSRETMALMPIATIPTATLFMSLFFGTGFPDNGVASQTLGMCAVGLAYGSWWDSFVGNILGRPGKTSGGSWRDSFVGKIPGHRGKVSVWKYTDPALNCDALGSNCAGKNANWTDLDIWKLGYDPERWGMYPDPKTLSTVIRELSPNVGDGRDQAAAV
jgi:hypothetical protein